MNSKKPANREETLLIRTVLELHERGPGSHLKSAELRKLLGIQPAYATKVAERLAQLGLVRREWGKIVETGWVTGDHGSRYLQSVERQEPNRPAVAAFAVEELLRDAGLVVLDTGNTARLVMVALAAAGGSRTVLTANASPVTDLPKGPSEVHFELLGGRYDRNDHMLTPGLCIDPAETLERVRSRLEIEWSIVVPGTASVLGGGIDLWTERPGEKGLRRALIGSGNALCVLLGGPDRLGRKGSKFARLGPGGLRGLQDVTVVCGGACRDEAERGRVRAFVEAARAAGATVHLVDPKESS